MIRATLLTLLLLSFLLGGCSSMNPESLKQTEPKLDLFDYFSGHTRAWGIFQGRTGDLKRRFTADIRGQIEGNLLTLTEDFVYTDGERSQRVWRIRREPDSSYSGEAEDVVGTATGHSYGSAFNWRYTLRLPFAGSSVDVKFNDWMFLQPDGVLLNRASVSKLGFKVGEVTLSFQKAD